MLQILVIIKLQSFLIFILLLILDNIIQYIFYKIHYKRYYSYIFKIEVKDKSITKNLKNLFWHKIGGLIVFNTDLILISKFISLEIVGICKLSDDNSDDNDNNKYSFKCIKA